MTAFHDRCKHTDREHIGLLLTGSRDKALRSVSIASERRVFKPTNGD